MLTGLFATVLGTLFGPNYHDAKNKWKKDPEVLKALKAADKQRRKAQAAVDSYEKKYGASGKTEKYKKAIAGQANTISIHKKSLKSK
jgi:hypothetical protein